MSPQKIAATYPQILCDYGRPQRSIDQGVVHLRRHQDTHCIFRRIAMRILCWTLVSIAGLALATASYADYERVFAFAAGWPNFPTEVSPADMYLGDIDGDGDTEIVAFQESSPSFRILSPNTGVIEYFGELFAPHNVHATYLSDLDGDGTPELFVLTDLGDLYLYDYQGGSEAPDSDPSSFSSGLLTSPNPTGPGATISFALERPSDVKVYLLDAAGRVVRNLESGRLGAGEHRVSWDGTGDSGAMLPAGVYFSQMELDGRPAASQKVVVVR
jgi:hypothetical protein